MSFKSSCYGFFSKFSDEPASGKRLHRPKAHRKIYGVCQGIADYFDISPTLVRVLWIGLSIVSGFWVGILAYLIAAYIIPTERELEEMMTRKWAREAGSTFAESSRSSSRYSQSSYTSVHASSGDDLRKYKFKGSGRKTPAAGGESFRKNAEDLRRYKFGQDQPKHSATGMSNTESVRVSLEQNLSSQLAAIRRPNFFWPVFMIIISSFMLLGGTIAFFEDLGDYESYLVPIGIGLGLLLLGLFIRGRKKENHERRRKDTLERCILALARSRGGKLFTSEVAAALALPLKDAREALNEISEHLYVNVEVNENGALYYEFPELSPGSEKTKMEASLADEIDQLKTTEAPADQQEKSSSENNQSVGSMT